MEAGCLIECAEVAGNGGGLLVVLAELGVEDFQCPQKMGLSRFEIAICLGKEAEVIGHGRDV